MRKAIIIFIIVSLSGCASLVPWTRMKGDEYTDSRRKFKAVVPEGWMRYNMVKYFAITKDGTVLDEIIVERYKLDDDLEFTKKKFSADMTPQDLAEIEIDNFRANDGIDRFTVLVNKPAAIDKQNGFRVEYSYTAQGGLKKKGIACGFLYDKYVYRIRYEAAAQYYFDKYSDAFERFLESFKVLSD